MDTKCALCRREGTKLFLKGERCFGAKCAMIRKAYAPGIFGKAGRKRRTNLTEYGRQLRQKQELKRIYGLREKQFKNYFKEASKKKGDTAFLLVEYLERRLDNVVYRLGLAKSRTMARQLVGHGYILVNDKKVNIPSYQISINDKISINPAKGEKKLFKELKNIVKDYQPPKWVKIDKSKLTGELTSSPDTVEASMGINLSDIVEFYSR